MEPVRLVRLIRRAWTRDGNLSVARRLLKGIRLAAQLIRARRALKDCSTVGIGARVGGRMRVENLGTITLGDRLNVNSNWVPIEMTSGSNGRIDIGSDVLINFGTVIAAATRVTIGSGCMIGPHCIISDLDIPEAATDIAAKGLPITIGKDVWIAGRVTIRPGVSIGDGAVIVAGSIVDTNVPPQTMAIGIPAKLLPKLGTGPLKASNAVSIPVPVDRVVGA
jgi:acetyltransferase-like isoleucine patch superfamily enzyme